MYKHIHYQPIYIESGRFPWACINKSMRYNWVNQLHLIRDTEIEKKLSNEQLTKWIMCSREYMWLNWGVLCQKHKSMAGTSNYIPQYLWDVVTCACLCYTHSTCGCDYLRLPLMHVSGPTLLNWRSKTVLGQIKNFCCIVFTQSNFCMNYMKQIAMLFVRKHFSCQENVRHSKFVMTASIVHTTCMPAASTIRIDHRLGHG